MHSSGDLALVGGTDGAAGVYSVSQNQVLQSLDGGDGAITGTLWAGDKAVVSTSSGQVRVFSAKSDGQIGSFGVHAGSATAIALHPCGDILASVGEDRSYVLYDLTTMKLLTQISSTSSMYCSTLGLKLLTVYRLHMR